MRISSSYESTKGCNIDKNTNNLKKSFISPENEKRQKVNQNQTASDFKNYKDQILLELLKQYIDNPEEKQKEDQLEMNSSAVFQKETQNDNSSNKRVEFEFSSKKHEKISEKKSDQKSYALDLFPNFKDFNNFSFEMLVNGSNPQTHSL